MSIVLKKSKLRILSPFLMGLVFFFFYLPITILFVFSFNSKPFPAPWESFTLKWYGLLFSHGEVWSSFWNSCLVAMGSTFICITLSIFMIYFLSTGGKIERFIPLFYGNLVIPETVLAIALISYFVLLNIPLGLHTVAVAHSIIGLGFALPMLYVRYKELDSKIFEASRNLGASHLQTFTRITLPLMRPTLIATGLMIFILSFDDFVLAYFCSGNGAQTLSLFLVTSLRWGISPIINALASILLFITIVLAGVFFSLKRKTRIL